MPPNMLGLALMLGLTLKAAKGPEFSGLGQAGTYEQCCSVRGADKLCPQASVNRRLTGSSPIGNGAVACLAEAGISQRP